MQHMFKHLQLYPSCQKKNFFSITDIPFDLYWRGSLSLEESGVEWLRCTPWNRNSRGSILSNTGVLSQANHFTASPKKYTEIREQEEISLENKCHLDFMFLPLQKDRPH